ncbi:MAG TPA: hypothetical protein VFH73_13195, partial [Polyangia bacterium]|nr:hypothetical protein [Polyangia bacterium]
MSLISLRAASIMVALGQRPADRLSDRRRVQALTLIYVGEVRYGSESNRRLRIALLLVPSWSARGRSGVEAGSSNIAPPVVWGITTPLTVDTL